jgi:hypothetical protein
MVVNRLGPHRWVSLVRHTVCCVAGLSGLSGLAVDWG